MFYSLWILQTFKIISLSFSQTSPVGGAEMENLCENSWQV